MIKKTVIYLLVFSVVLLTMVGCNSKPDETDSTTEMTATYTKIIGEGLVLGVEPEEIFDGRTGIKFSCSTDKSLYSLAAISAPPLTGEDPLVLNSVLRNRETGEKLERLSDIGTMIQPYYRVEKQFLDRYTLEYDVNLLLALPDTDEIKLTWSEDDEVKEINQKISLPDGKSIVVEKLEFGEDSESSLKEYQLKVYYTVYYTPGWGGLSCEPYAIKSKESSTTAYGSVPSEWLSRSEGSSSYVFKMTMPEDADSFVFCFSDINYHKRFTGTMDLDL